MSSSKKPTAGPHTNTLTKQKTSYNIEQALANAIRKHQSGNLHQAEEIYREILSVNPNHAETLHAQAIMACQRQQHAMAVTLFEKAIHQDPNKAVYHYNLGNALKDLERFDEAIPCYGQALLLKPDYVDALNNLGTILHNQGKFEEAISAYQEALRIAPDHAGAHYNMGITLQNMDRMKEAVLSYQKALAANGDFPEVYNRLGKIFYEQGNLDSAIGCFQQTLRIDPNVAAFHFDLAAALKEQGRLDEAIVCYQKVLELSPEMAVAYNNLGNLFKEQGRLPEAETSLRRAITLKPSYAMAYGNLGNVLKDQRLLLEAQACFRRALELNPDCAEIHNNLGNTLRAQGRFTEAEASLRRAITLKPSYAMAYGNLGNVLKDQSLIIEAESCYRRALELMPDYADVHSNLLFCLSHNGTLDTETLFSEHCQFGAQFETPFRTNYPQFTNSPNPERPLRIGFVSGDLRDHAVAYFIEPILIHLSNYPQLSLYAYSNHAIEDSITQRLRGHFADWHSIVGLNDLALAEKIRADSIDILIDLSGHTAKNRLLAFARKPAPVQASWIGYPGTTGLKAMDYYLADRFLLPPARFDNQFTEKIVRLPANAPFLPSRNAPPVNILPALSNGHITFGSFNRPSKLSPSVISLWSQLLHALPDSRMLLGDAPQDGTMDALIDLFARGHILQERLIFYPRCNMDSYLALHQQVDICLDTFPYNGGTTTCHALWMGIPTLTLTGDTLPGRTGAAILGHVGLEDFIASDKDDFVKKGLKWTKDLATLAHLRAELRGRFERSAPVQPALIAASLERALRIMWQRWCAGQPPESFEVDLEEINSPAQESKT